MRWCVIWISSRCWGTALSPPDFLTLDLSSGFVLEVFWWRGGGRGEAEPCFKPPSMKRGQAGGRLRVRWAATGDIRVSWEGDADWNDSIRERGIRPGLHGRGCVEPEPFYFHNVACRRKLRYFKKTYKLNKVAECSLVGCSSIITSQLTHGWFYVIFKTPSPGFEGSLCTYCSPMWQSHHFKRMWECGEVFHVGIIRCYRGNDKVLTLNNKSRKKWRCLSAVEE